MVQEPETGLGSGIPTNESEFKAAQTLLAMKGNQPKFVAATLDAEKIFTATSALAPLPSIAELLRSFGGPTSNPFLNFEGNLASIQTVLS